MLTTTPRVRLADSSRPDLYRLTVAYQPFVDLHSGRLVGAEALARFGTPATGHVLRQAELEGRSEAIDLAVLRWVIDDLLTDAAGGIPVHVNVSAASIPGPRYLSTVSRWLRPEPRIAQRLVFEVTETAPLPNATAVRRFAEGVRRLGSGLAVDDAPVGYDRMHAINLLQPDVVKLDGSTLRRSLDDATDRVRLEAMSIMARDHDALVIAEGIESPAHVEAALRFGAGVGQGYHLGRARSCALADVRPFQLG